MEIIVREVRDKLIRTPFFPNAQKWFKQNPPSEFCIASIGRIVCFVKRQSNQFSGWGLLVKAISEGQLRHTPRVISIAQHQGLYYYFTEKLDGMTLDEFLKKTWVSRLNVNKLVNSVFIALRNINQYGFWYSDLCRKNVFVLRNGDFCLIDLDSCIPSTKPFFYDGKVAVEYPPLLREFANDVGRSNFQIRGLAGECVNQAEIIAMAVDCKESFRIPMDRKIPVVHRCLMREAGQEYKDLFFDLMNNKPNWVNTRKVIDKLLT